MNRVYDFPPPYMLVIAFLISGLSGCGDACDRACGIVTTNLADCARGPWSVDGERSVTWEDLGADSLFAFRQQCRDDWEAASVDLESRELQQALETCQIVMDESDALTCDEWRALYL